MSLNPPPPPNGQVLQLVSALSNPQNHVLHVQAIQARDLALSSSQESYNHLCVQLSYLLVGCDRPVQMLQSLEEHYPMEAWWRHSNHNNQLQSMSELDVAIRKLQMASTSSSSSSITTTIVVADDFWIRFGQTAGFALKQALLHPPQQLHQQDQYLPPLVLTSTAADQVKETLLYAIHACQNTHLKSVASSIIATTAVSVDGIQPSLHILAWPQLVPSLLSAFPNATQQQSSYDSGFVEGPLATVRKMMEDGPTEMDHDTLDLLIPPLIQILSNSTTKPNSSSNEKAQVSALQAIHAGLDANLMPSALVLHFASYLTGLSTLAASPSPVVRQWVCRSLVVLLSNRTEYLQSHLDSIIPFIMTTCQDYCRPQVALEACEFWLTFASLDESIITPSMSQTVANLLPQLVPRLVRGMVYLPEQQLELQAQNELDLMAEPSAAGMRPVFHRNRSKHGGGGGGSSHVVATVGFDDQDGLDEDIDDDNGDNADDDDDDDDDFDGGEGSEWTLRKCCAASLDALANMYGPVPILPPLLPALQEGLSSNDPWIQEASILALGAVAEGCRDEMYRHMPQLFPYLLTLLTSPETPESLPQLKCIAAWTIGRYASWAVDQVQTGTQGHLLAQITEVFLQRLPDRNRKVQVACCSAFAVVIEAAGDLMAPYLEPIYLAFAAALTHYQGRSMLVLFDTMGVLADYVGPAIGEGNLPALYIPPLLLTWGELAKQDPTDRKLLPLLECLASTAVTCGVNFQPFALEAFENAMCTIEVVTLMTATPDSTDARNGDEEEADPIVCATDLLDGLVEGLGANFPRLLASSHRYGPTFASMLFTLLQNDVPGVRMSALALLGDLARQSPSLLEANLPQLLQETIRNIDPVHPSVCSNAVWAVGEVCVRCRGSPEPLEPFASSLLQNLIPLLMGNGVVSGKGRGGRGVAIPGLLENAAAAAGRLALVNPAFVATDLPRFLLGWCDGMAKISDPTERRDAFEGFIQALYANPQCIHQAARNVADAVSSVLFAIVSWHMPLNSSQDDAEEDGDDEPSSFLYGEYAFYPFPTTEAKLGEALKKLMIDIKSSVGQEEWRRINQQLPVNVRRLLREAYQL